MHLFLGWNKRLLNARGMKYKKQTKSPLSGAETPEYVHVFIDQEVPVGKFLPKVNSVDGPMPLAEDLRDGV